MPKITPFALAALLASVTPAAAVESRHAVSAAAVAMTADMCAIAIPPELGLRVRAALAEFAEQSSEPARAEYEATLRAMSKRFTQQRAALCSDLNATGLAKLAATALE